MGQFKLKFARPTAEVLRTIREELSPELAGEFGANLN
jgi:uncharacterized protein (DUF2267 family)